MDGGESSKPSGVFRPKCRRNHGRKAHHPPIANSTSVVSAEVKDLFCDTLPVAGFNQTLRTVLKKDDTPMKETQLS